MDEIAECPECYGHGQIMDEHMMPHGDCSRCGGSGIDDRAIEARFARMDATNANYRREHSPNDARAEGWDPSMDDRDDS